MLTYSDSHDAALHELTLDATIVFSGPSDDPHTDPGMWIKAEPALRRRRLR